MEVETPAKGGRGASLKATEATWQGLLVAARRSLTDPGTGLLFCCDLAGKTLEELVRVAGSRQVVEECLEEAKGKAGQDQYGMRRRDG